MSFLEPFRTADPRARRDLLQDALGASALFVMLIVGLHLPAFV